MKDETTEIIKQIKEIAKRIDSSNKQEVDICLCEIIDLCDKVII